MKLIVLLFLTRLLLTQDVEQIDLGAEPLKKDGITLTNEQIIKKEEGFYQRISATYTPDGRLIVFDHGNSQFNVYDKNHVLASQFGKEGSGPGEIQKNFIWIIKASNKYIYAQLWNEVTIYKMDGTLVKEIKGFHYFQKGRIQLINNQLVTIQPNSKRFKYTKSIFSDVGELILEVEAKKDLNPKKEKGFEGMEADFRERRQTFQLGKLIYDIDVADYKLFVTDLDRNSKFILKRDFNRVKYDPKKYEMKTEGMSKERAAHLSSISKAYTNMYKGYDPAIQFFGGASSGYFFLPLNLIGDEIVIDVVSDKNEWYTQLKFEEKELSFIIIDENKLIKYFKSDEDGPYLKTYDITFNKEHVRK
jgi:hypothetical protein